MKTYVLCSISLKELPPALSTILCLNDLHMNIEMIVPYLDDEYKEMFNTVGINYHEFTNKNNWLAKVQTKNVIKRYYNLAVLFNKYIFNILKNANKNDIIWILHEESAFVLSKKIFKYKYILSIYEMRNNTNILKVIPSNLIKIAQNASCVVTPEYNRSQILYCKWNLKKVPITLPNKPYTNDHITYATEELSKRTEILSKRIKNKKAILYQGAFGPDRNLEPFIETVNELDDYVIVLMGSKNDYLLSLLNKYGEKIIYLPSLPAPLHLEITKLAYIGIVSYETKQVGPYDALNVAYCAPNKIYEYSRYSIPMICTNQPGLLYTVHYYHAGECVDANDLSAIRQAIKRIGNHYQDYSKGSAKLYESVNVKNIIENIITSTNSD